MKTKSTIILSIVALLLSAFASPILLAPALAAGSSSSISSTSSYSPQPGDALLTRDKVFLDMAKSRLIVGTGSPVKVQAVIAGNLPDPCHVLRVVVGSTLSSRTISIQVYSLYKAGVACVTVLKPFSVTVPLGSFSSGQYIVLLNGIKLGAFSASSTTTLVTK